MGPKESADLLHKFELRATGPGEYELKSNMSQSLADIGTTNSEAWDNFAGLKLCSLTVMEYL